MRSRGSTAFWVLAYDATLVVAAAAVGAVLLRRAPEPPLPSSWLALPILIALLVAAEYLYVRFRFGGEVNGLNLVEAVLAPMLVAFPGGIVVASVAAAQVIGAILRRNPFQKAAFNVGQWSLVAGLGALVVADLGPSLTGREFAGIVVALAVVAVVNQFLFTIVLSIANRTTPAEVLRGLGQVIIPGWIVGWLLNSVVGSLFVLAYATHPAAVLLFPVPLVVLHLAYRGYAGARSDRARLAGLHDATLVLSRPIDPTEAIPSYLREVARCFEARAVELVLGAADGRVIHRFHAEDGRYVVDREEHLFPSLEGALLGHQRAVRLTRTSPGGLASALVDAGWRDCLAAPLIDGDRNTGVLLVLDQAGLEGFESGELAVMEALARETATLLAKGRLMHDVVDERRKLNEIVSTTSDGIFTVSSDGIVRSWNKAMERITGLSSGEVIGRAGGLDPLDIRSREGRPVRLDRWANDRALPREIVVRGLRGGRSRLSCSYSEADAGAPSATLVVIARDITPQEEIRELRRRYGELVEAEAAQRAVVEQLQEALMPPQPDTPNVDLSVRYLASDPTAPTGGDLYDWQVLPNGELHVSVVDVLGHGVAATRSALDVMHVLRFLALSGCPLGELIERADTILAGQNADVVATVVVVRYNPEDGTARIAAGGHPPALLVSPDRGVRQLAAAGGAIGWPGAGSQILAEASLREGESLLLYTDGLVEARKDIIQGEESLMRYARELADRSADELAHELVERVLSDADRRDDSLALVIRRAPAVDRLAFSIRPDPGEASAARSRLGEWLTERGIDDGVGAEVTLIAAELLSNAVRAARSRVGVRAELEHAWIRVEVEDDGIGDPGLASHGTSPPASDAPAGRGLFIVRSLADDLSILSTSAGTVVRATKRAARRERRVTRLDERTRLPR